MRLGRLVWFFIVPMSLVGCGGPAEHGLTLAPVSGTVKYKGAPVESGTVTFYPETGDRPASGALGPGGKFTLGTFETGDGARVGTHKITVQAFRAGAAVSVGNPAEESLLPVNYTDVGTTPLLKQVQEGPNDLIIEIEE